MRRDFHEVWRDVFMSRRRRITFILLYAGFPLVLAEAAAWAVAKLPGTRSRFFSSRDAILSQLRAGDYERFLATYYDPVLGWDNPSGGVKVLSACDGRDFAVRYLPDRTRRTPEAPGPEVLVFGDSYSHGDEVGDGDTYPAQLSRLIGRKVVNHAVPGYGSLQAVLKFERRAADHPSARVVILGITSENPLRELNAYRPAYFAHSGGIFGFKPYLRAGELHDNPNGPLPRPFTGFVDLVARGFRKDYFALPDARVPYSLGLLRSLRAPAVWLGALRKLDYARLLEVDEVRRAIDYTVRRFTAAALARGLRPIVLFIPQSRQFRGVFRATIARLAGTGAALHEVDGDHHPWAQYQDRVDCHPSAIGYGVIAAEAAQAVREAER